MQLITIWVITIIAFAWTLTDTYFTSITNLPITSWLPLINLAIMLIIAIFLSVKR